MPRRKDRFGYGVTIPATTARVVDTAVEILGDPDPKTRDYMREYGRASMVSVFLPEGRIFGIRIPPELGSSHIESF